MWRMKSLTAFVANEIPMGQVACTRKQNASWQALVCSLVSKPRKVLELPWISLPKSLVNLSLAGCHLSEAAFPRDFRNLVMLQDLNLSKNPISYLPDCIRTLSRLNRLELSSCTMLKSLIDLPHVYSLSVGYCTSLEKITYQSVACQSTVYHLVDCEKLNDVEGNFTVKDVGGIEKDVMKSLEFSMLDNVGSFDVELYNNSTNTESRGPVKALFERGMISIFIPGSMIPNWFCYKNVGAAVSFTVPLLPDLKIQGLNVCTVYTIDMKDWVPGVQFYTIIHNEQKNVKTDL